MKQMQKRVPSIDANVHTYGKAQLARILRSLYRRTGPKLYERVASNPGMPKILCPDSKEPKMQDFLGTAESMLASMTERQVQTIVHRVGSSKGRGRTD